MYEPAPLEAVRLLHRVKLNRRDVLEVTAGETRRARRLCIDLTVLRRCMDQTTGEPIWRQLRNFRFSASALPGLELAVSLLRDAIGAEVEAFEAEQAAHVAAMIARRSQKAASNQVVPLIRREA